MVGVVVVVVVEYGIVTRSSVIWKGGVMEPTTGVTTRAMIAEALIFGV